MKLGILCAVEDELAPFLPMLTGAQTEQRARLTIHTGRIEGVEVAALYCGVGKVNAALATQLLIEHCGCQAVINAGAAGGIDPSLQPFDTVVGTEVAHHDVAPEILTDYHPWLPSIWLPADPALLQLARQAQVPHRVVFGRMITGEAFIDGEQREILRARYQPLSVDMESAAAAQVCYAYQIPFLSVRTITDTQQDEDGAEAYEENNDRASALAAQLVQAMLRGM